MKFLSLFILLFISTSSIFAQSGKSVFETYCWGCHHQSAVAFGPSFAQIANRRSVDEIRAMITDPKAVSKLFGYKRSAMPAFKLTQSELEEITKFVLSFKKKENN